MENLIKLMKGVYYAGKKIYRRSSRKKNARQKEYLKKTKYAADIRSKKKNTKRYVLQITINTEPDIIQKLDEEKEKEGYATYIKRLIREDIEK